MVENGYRTDYMYNQLNQLTDIKNAKFSQDFSYDARGNITRISENGEAKITYEFDPTNRLSRATNSEGRIADYEYNGLGYRIGKQITEDLILIWAVSSQRD